MRTVVVVPHKPIPVADSSSRAVSPSKRGGHGALGVVVVRLRCAPLTSADIAGGAREWTTAGAAEADQNKINNSNDKKKQEQKQERQKPNVLQ